MAKYLHQIELTSSRNEMTELLAKLFKRASIGESDRIVHLLLGRLGPPYEALEFGIANKTMIKVLAITYAKSEGEVQRLFERVGDLGDVAEIIGNQQLARINKSALGSELSVGKVYRKLRNIATVSGEGSQEKKIVWLAELLKQVDPLSAKYIVRIPLGRLRLGFSDVTILDALSIMEVGDKSERKEIERAYNVSADIGRIVRRVKELGVGGLREIKVRPGVPIRPAAAERLPSAEAIIEKLGRVAAEPKIDGFRLQVHYYMNHAPSDLSGNTYVVSNGLELGDGKFVKLFSRNLEDMTEMFPEIIKAIEQLDVREIILEGEAVAYNPDTEEFLPFQETVQRRRKYDIKEKAKEIPLKLFAFDLLYLNGDNYLDKPYKERRKQLAGLLSSCKGVLTIVREGEYEDAESLQRFFLEQVEHGLEGIMVKRLDAPYAAGARSNNWVKLKREEKSELDDTIDCVVMGYKYGTGKRSKFGIGAFLVGTYDGKADVFRTISNVGTGLTDDQWREMKQRADRLRTKKKPARYDVPKGLKQDVWIQPEMTVEILADEITRSPLHTTGKEGSGSGYALRFPRLIKWRDDKKPEQATTVAEVGKMFRKQLQR